MYVHFVKTVRNKNPRSLQVVQAQFVCVCTFVCLCVCMCRIWCAGYVHNNASVYVHVQCTCMLCENNAQSVCVCVYVRVCV